jgi:hypothetical protein
MILRKLSSIILLLIIGYQSYAQDNRETVYVHLNSQVLVSGESIYLSAYCRSQLTGKSSDLSKILYVEIIGLNGPIYQDKLLLKNGRGNGEFFVSSLVPSGKYYLIAYTRWMKNFNEYFKAPIEIINPFEVIEGDTTQGKELSVDFYIQNNRPVTGLRNTIGFKINSHSRETPSFKVKVVSSSGETVTSCNHDKYGLGVFSINPLEGESYNMILEDEVGKIEFFGIPDATKEGISIDIDTRLNRLDVELKSNGPTDEICKLIVYDGFNQVINQPVALNSRTSLALENISGDLLNVEVSNSENRLIGSKRFYKVKFSSTEVGIESIIATRSMVNPNLKLDRGTYSISVRKKNGFLTNVHTNSLNNGWSSQLDITPIEPDELLSSSPKSDIETFLLGSTWKAPSSPPVISKLPEFRDEFLSGELKTANGLPLVDEIVSLTVFSEPFRIRSTKTSSNGSFSIPFEYVLQNTEGVVTSLSMDPSYEIMLDSPFIREYPDLSFIFYKLDSIQIREVVEKSIRIQIENAYFQLDSISLSTVSKPPQIIFNKEYTLDDYTRFNTLKETFVEYILEANVRERRVPKIKPYVSEIPENIKHQPLLLLDGVPVADEKILELGANNIERISILNNRFFLGPLINDGVILFKTFDGKMGRFQPLNYHKKLTINRVNIGHSYEFPSYENGIQTNKPDQRDQLYWNPELIIHEAGNHSFQFYTSDVEGQFEIIIEGYQEDGHPVSIIKAFSVN